MMDILNMVDYVIEENFINIGGSIFRQKCGIPMGANASPMLADLCLSWMEFEYLKGRNIHRPLKLFRYLDDVLVFNCERFTEAVKNIYGDKLQVEKTNQTNDKCQYLDLEIQLKPELRIKIYDKTRDFNFHVIKFPDGSSCIHSSLIYNCFQSQIYRFSLICNHLNDFIYNIKLLYDELKYKNTDLNKLYLTILRFCTQNRPLIAKYDIFTKSDILTLIIKPVTG